MEAIDCNYNPRCHSPKCRERITFDERNKSKNKKSRDVQSSRNNCPSSLSPQIPGKNRTCKPPLDSFTKELKPNHTLIRVRIQDFILFNDEILTNFSLLHKLNANLLHSPKIHLRKYDIILTGFIQS